MRIAVPPNVYSDVTGFRWLCWVAHQLRTSEDVAFDFSRNTFFDGNLCAVLGALFHRHNLDADAISDGQGQIRSRVLRALSMNDFVPLHGGAGFADEFDTTIKFRRFDVDQTKVFAFYLEAELLNKELPLRPQTKRAFRTALAEVFLNANLHSQTTSGVFSCGQHFPTKEIINYTLVDLGIGIGESVSRHFGRTIAAKTAINWAVVVGNSGRPTGQLGGFGLSDIQNIVAANEGLFQIVSGDALWESSRRRSETTSLPQPFEGTIVNLQINVALDKHRQLEEEMAKM